MNIRRLLEMTRGDAEEYFKSKCQSVYMGDGLLMCRVLDDFKMLVDPTNEDITPHLAFDGYWEMWLTLYLSRTVAPGWHCVDVGAHQGYYSLLLSRLVGEHGYVTALEPNPPMADICQRNAVLNGFGARFRVIEVAAGALPGVGKLETSERYSGGASLQPGHYKKFHGSTYFEDAEVVPLDEAIRHSHQVSLVKIDAEGMDIDVWQGMKRLRQNPDLITVLEFDPVQKGRWKEPLEQAHGDGYRFQKILFDGRTVDTTIAGVLTSDFCNIIIKR